jgi:hypothetical protein
VSLRVPLWFKKNVEQSETCLHKNVASFVAPLRLPKNMKYKNPIRILTPAQIKRLDSTTLKSIKKEILLHFQLTEGPTIERNGIVVDKNEVLEIFEELQQNLTLHLQIYKNKDLVHFLESGSMSFFSSRAAQQMVLEDREQQYQINGYIAFKLNQETAKFLENVNGSTPNRLSVIFDYTSKMAPEQQDKSYNKAYVTLKAKIDDLPVAHPHPFSRQGGMALHESIPELVDLDFYNCFPYLPGAFKDIGFMYAAWCHNNVVNGAIRRQNLFGKYRRGDLFTLLEAYDIAEDVTTSENFKRTGRDLRQYLKVTKRSASSHRINTKKKPKVNISNKKSQSPNNKRTNSSGRSNTTKRKVRTKSSDGPWAKFLRWAFFSIIVIRLLFTIAECSNKKSSFAGEGELAERVMEETDSKTKTKTKTRRALGESRVGDKNEGWEQILIRSDLQDSLVELDYDVAVMPSQINDFATFIPEEVFDKYKGKEMDFVLQVRDTAFPTQVFRHRFRYDLAKNGRRKRIVYDGRKNSNGNKDRLTIDRMKRLTKPMLGTITRYSSGGTMSTKKTSFEITYNKSKADAPRVEGLHGAVDDGRFEKYKSYEISEGLSEEYKNLVMNNLNIIHYKDLKLGNYYTLKKSLSYPLVVPDMTEAPFSITKLEEIKGTLNYYSCSNEDDIALCSLNGEGYVVRYFVDRKAKRVVRMQMAIVGLRGGVVEVIEVVL